MTPAIAPDRLMHADHRSAHGSWRIASLTPTAFTRPYLRRLHSYAEQATAFTRRRELPGGCAVMVFNLGPELRVEHPLNTRTDFAGGTGFYSGASSTYAVTETDGAQDGAQLVLTLPGARRLLGRPLSEIGDRLADLVEALGRSGYDTLGRLMEARSDGDRLAILEGKAIARFAEEQAAPRDVEWTWQRLQASGGRLRIGALAQELGCSRKHLTVRFQREFGLPPKLFARLVRFQRALARLDGVTPVCWATLAAACGYADQAHLTRDFQAFSGSPPAALLRRRLPDDGGVRDTR